MDQMFICTCEFVIMCVSVCMLGRWEVLGFL